ncbi:hypothetical protein K0M31_001724, partial [Melipona bicolor]
LLTSSEIEWVDFVVCLFVAIKDSRAESNRIRGEREIRFVSRILLEFACRSLCRTSANPGKKREHERKRRQDSERERERVIRVVLTDHLAYTRNTHGYSDTSGLFFVWTRKSDICVKIYIRTFESGSPLTCNKNFLRSTGDIGMGV